MEMEMERRPREGDELTRLYEASIEGSLITFNPLTQKDPLILNRISLTTFNETPLHITALLGHLNFTRQLLLHEPKLASELDSHNRSPLHLASAEGHAELVQALLQENGDGDQSMCLAKDQDGKIPLHYAALRGRIDVIELLINARMMPDGQTVMHLCVRCNHLKALLVLVQSQGAYDQDFQLIINSKEHAHGNTILHLAVMLKQAEETIDHDKGNKVVFECSKEDMCFAGTSILARAYRGVLYKHFIIFNSISFLASLIMILLLLELLSL